MAANGLLNSTNYIIYFKILYRSRKCMNKAIAIKNMEMPQPIEDIKVNDSRYNAVSFSFD